MGKRTKEKRDRDRIRIKQLFVFDGWTERQIAEELGISELTVNDDLRAIKRTLEDDYQTLEHARFSEMRKIDHVISRAMDAYEESIGPKKEIRETETSGESSSSSTQVTKWKEVGEPKFLAIALRGIEIKSRVLGLEKPVKPEEQLVKHEHFGTIAVEHARAELHRILIAVDDRQGGAAGAGIIDRNLLVELAHQPRSVPEPDSCGLRRDAEEVRGDFRPLAEN